MRRAYAVDVLTCRRCAGPMRLIAVIENEIVARKILLHLGLPARAPPRGRAWRSGAQEQPALDDPERYDGIDEPALN